MRVFSDYESPITYAASIAKPHISLALEFGVASGKTINIIANDIKEVHGFDSFEGLPEFWRAGFDEGTFAQDPPQVADNVTLHKGWFKDTLPEFINEHKDILAAPKLIHIDCDLYSSTAVVLRELSEYILGGDIICFDEFHGYSGWMEHEAKAFEEFISDTRHSPVLLAIGPEQAVFQI